MAIFKLKHSLITSKDGIINSPIFVFNGNLVRYACQASEDRLPPHDVMAVVIVVVRFELYLESPETVV